MNWSLPRFYNNYNKTINPCNFLSLLLDYCGLLLYIYKSVSCPVSSQDTDALGLVSVFHCSNCSPYLTSKYSFSWQLYSSQPSDRHILGLFHGYKTSGPHKWLSFTLLQSLRIWILLSYYSCRKTKSFLCNANAHILVQQPCDLAPVCLDIKHLFSSIFPVFMFYVFSL